MGLLHLASYLSSEGRRPVQATSAASLSSSRHQLLKAQIAAAKSEYEVMVELDKDITPLVRALFSIKRKATATLTRFYLVYLVCTLITLHLLLSSPLFILIY